MIFPQDSQRQIAPTNPVGLRTNVSRRHARNCLSTVAILIAILIFAGAVMAQGDTCETGVRVAFQGSVCARDPFNLTLNGAVGSGDGNCTAVNWSNTNKIYTKLRINQTYTLSLDAESCATYVNFNVPDDYKVYVNDEETQTIARPAGTTAAYTWKIVVRRKCNCSGSASGAPGSSAGPQLNKVVWDASLGNLSDGRSAETIGISEDVLSSYIYTPAALVYSPPILTSEVDVVRNGDGSLRQVKSSQTLADVVVISSSEYDIRFYRPADVGAKTGGVYVVTGQPYVTWKVKNTSDSSASKLSINRIENSTTEVNEYSWDPSGNSWTLSRSGGARVETKVSSYPNINTRIDTAIVKDNLGNVSSKSAKTYFTFPWGEELVMQVLDPDGAALTTTYHYYTNPVEDFRYQKLQSIAYPDGSWEKYDYDSAGNRVLVLRPWLDLALASATEANSRSTRYTYSNSDGIQVSLYARNIATSEEKIAGMTVSKTTYSRSATTINGDPAVTEIHTEYSAATVGQQTSTTTYHASASAFLAGRLVSVTSPDGRRDSYSYEKGNYTTNADPSLNQFTADVNGLAVRTTVIHGTDISPDGVAMKTTKEATVRDQFGNEVLQETHVYNGTGYERIAWSVKTYDDRGHLTQTTRHTGQVATAIWDGDKRTSGTNESGIQTDYTYDSLSRTKTKTKKGVAANGSFPAQADIITTLNYDAQGLQTSETVASGSLSLTSSTLYDLAGRLKKITDQAGLVTSYAYANGGRTQTVTAPGGATQITDKFVDGQVKSITGTAVVSRYFGYGVNADGTKYTQDFIGPNGLNSPRWTKTTSDWAGRNIQAEKPGFTGTTLVQTSTYNGQGQLQSESAMAGSSKLMADKLHAYDELGRQIRVGLDIDGSGDLTAASTDRFTETSLTYEKVGSDWFTVSTTTTYLADNNTTPTIQTQRGRLTNFAINGADKGFSETTVTDVAGNNNRATSAVDRTAKKTTVTTDMPDSNIDAVSITINGLLQSSTPATPQFTTTYAYDALGRAISVTDPRTGTATSAYSGTTGQLISTGDSVQTTTYDYYLATQTNGGRLKSQSNVNGKKVYFNYNSRGDLVQTWGDTTYPLEYVYDSYGQKTELHTYRAGAGWAGSAWPTTITGTADVTNWFYHDPTGLLTQKQDAATKQVAYTYDTLGRMASRAWARLGGNGNPISTAYAYDPNTGELRTIDYSDTTPDVSFTYDRGGQQNAITDSAGSHTRTFNAGGQLQTEQIAGGVLDGVQVTVGYDSFLRRNSLQAAYNAASLTSQTYTYDTSSRLGTVVNGAQTATYAYYPTTGFLNTTTFTGGTSIARSYDTLGRLQSIVTSTPALGTVASYAYTYNSLSQRTKVTRENGSYWSYGYNDRGELVFGRKFWSDNSLVMGQQTEYAFDNIGNRNSTKAGGNELGSLRQSTYIANSLNEYTQRTVPGAVDVLGIADPSASVTVNDQATTRKADYFYKELVVNNAAAPVYAQINVVGAKNNYGAGGEDAIAQQGGRVYVPQAVEPYVYDADGNLTGDGRWVYTWDAENRLTSVQAVASAPVEAKRRLEFVYDYMGRRIQKKVYNWNVSTSSYQLQSTTKFIYDGWSLVAELDGSNVLIRSYVRGGGELLLVNGGGNAYQVGYDGNQNVGVLIKASDGSVSAAYDYDPFGQTAKAVGAYATQNPFRFSDQYTDVETGVIYYGYRYYNPQTGRWISRDPSEEASGVNLYGFLSNDGANSTDLLGLWRAEGNWSGGWHKYSAIAVADKACDKLGRLAFLITGYESDWHALGRSSDKVNKDEKVNIAPLLVLLEDRLRNHTLAAASTYNTVWGDFTDSTKPTAGLVNQYFGKPGKAKFGHSDCAQGLELVYAKAMVDVFGADEWNNWDLDLIQQIPQLLTEKPGGGRSGDMWLGDSAFVENYPDYKALSRRASPSGETGNSQGENIIKVGPSRFWGYTGQSFSRDVRSIRQWQNMLQNDYNAVGGQSGPSDQYPRFSGRISFVDTAKLARWAFEDRNK